MTDTLIETVAYLVANDDVTRADLVEALATQSVGRMKAEAERDRLRKALYPFAEAVDSLDKDHPDHYAISKSPAAMGINGGDLRKARAALEEDRT